VVAVLVVTVVANQVQQTMQDLVVMVLLLEQVQVLAEVVLPVWAQALLLVV
jgi:hypothetical protein